MPFERRSETGASIVLIHPIVPARTMLPPRSIPGAIGIVTVATAPATLGLTFVPTHAVVVTTGLLTAPATLSLAIVFTNTIVLTVTVALPLPTFRLALVPADPVVHPH